MNIYEITEIENKIEQYAYEHDGEIPDELIRELVEAQTKSIEQIEKLCYYVKHLENFVDTCKAEKARINDKQKTAENRIGSIKRYLRPYVFEHGKRDFGTLTLSTRKSSSVVLADDFNDPRFTTIETEYKHDKNRIKKAIKDGETVEGAQIIHNDNVVIK